MSEVSQSWFDRDRVVANISETQTRARVLVMYERNESSHGHSCIAVQVGNTFECSECGKPMSVDESPSQVLDSAANPIERGRKQGR